MGNENELVHYDAASVAAMIAAYRNESASDFNAGEEADLTRSMLYPTIIFDSKIAKMSIVLGSGENVSELRSEKEMTFAIVKVLGQRTLWLPKSQKSLDWNRPVCSTGLQPMDRMKSGRGNCQVLRGVWNPAPGTSPIFDDDGVGPQVRIPCSACPQAVFGSKAAWDGEDSRAQACGESRVYLAIPVRYVADQMVGNSKVAIFEWDRTFVTPGNKLGMVIMTVSLASNRDAVRTIAMNVQTSRLPLPALAMGFTTRIHSDGDRKYAILNPSVQGMINKPDFDEWAARKHVIDEFIEDSKEVSSTTFISNPGFGNASGDVEDNYGTGTGTGTTVNKDDIPF
jgi:hypothetical protein